LKQLGIDIRMATGACLRHLMSRNFTTVVWFESVFTYIAELEVFRRIKSSILVLPGAKSKVLACQTTFDVSQHCTITTTSSLMVRCVIKCMMQLVHLGAFGYAEERFRRQCSYLIGFSQQPWINPTKTKNVQGCGVHFFLWCS
jgi:hypothetical protein